MFYSAFARVALEFVRKIFINIVGTKRLLFIRKWVVSLFVKSDYQTLVVLICFNMTNNMSATTPNETCVLTRPFLHFNVHVSKYVCLHIILHL